MRGSPRRARPELTTAPAGVIVPSMTTGNREQAHVLVTGVVQGVGFRWFVLEQARALGLAGTVRNRPDGSVEIVAEGPRPALVRLIRLVTTGPPLARVREVRARWGRAAGEDAGEDGGATTGAATDFRVVR